MTSQASRLFPARALLIDWKALQRVEIVALVEMRAAHLVENVCGNPFAALGVTLDSTFRPSRNFRRCGSEPLWLVVANLARTDAMLISLEGLVPGLRVQLFIYFLPARCLCGPLGRRKIGSAQVLVDHRKLGMEVIVLHDAAGHINKTESPGRLKPMMARNNFVGVGHLAFDETAHQAGFSFRTSRFSFQR
jgi:hypothetical protein